MVMSTVVTSTLVASIILMVNVDHGDHECHWAKIQQTNANGKRSKALPIGQIYLYYAKFDLFSSETLLNRMGKEHWTSNKSIMWSMPGKSIMQPPTNPSLMCVTNNQLWLFRSSFIVFFSGMRRVKDSNTRMGCILTFWHLKVCLIETQNLLSSSELDDLELAIPSHGISSNHILLNPIPLQIHNQSEWFW